MSKQYHIGLVGCGDWGCYILRDLNSLGCKVTVVARSEQTSLEHLTEPPRRQERQGNL